MFTQADIENYYSAFKHAHLFLIILGSISLITAIIFYFWFKTAGHRGFAVTLFVSGLLFCTAGFGNFTSARPLSIRAAYNFDMHPELFRAKELARTTELQKKAYSTYRCKCCNHCAITASVLLFSQKERQ